MFPNPVTRFWIEAALAGVTAILSALTLISREWIEVVFKVDPDGGDGTIEWLFIGGFFVTALALGLTAYLERCSRRAASYPIRGEAR